jgi:pilus assembly protein CpaB
MNRRTRTLVVVSVAVLLASAASFGVYRAISMIPVREVPIATRYAVVAKVPVKVGTLLTVDHVRLTAWPAESPVKGGFESVEPVVGRGVTSELIENEPVTEGKLASREAGGGLPPRIPAGMRAMSVRVNDVIGVAGFAVPGTRVDVVVTLRDGQQQGLSRTVLSNIQVLASGPNTDLEKARAGEAMATPVITLLVTPENAERLALAQSQGTIVLALRNPLDADTTQTAGVRMSALVGAPDPKPVQRLVGGKPRMVTPQGPPPPPGPPPPYTVEMVRGATRTEVIIKK